VWLVELVAPSVSSASLPEEKAGAVHDWLLGGNRSLRMASSSDIVGEE